MTHKPSLRSLHGTTLRGFVQVSNHNWRDLGRARAVPQCAGGMSALQQMEQSSQALAVVGARRIPKQARAPDRESTRLNSSHPVNSYGVFFLKKKKKQAAVPEA